MYAIDLMHHMRVHDAVDGMQQLPPGVSLPNVHASRDSHQYM